MKKAFAVVLICLVTLLCGCGIIARGIASGMMDYSEEPEQTAQILEGKGTLDKFEIEILEAKRAVTYDGKGAVEITYRWTNNSNETLMFMDAFDNSVFQDGIELDRSFTRSRDLDRGGIDTKIKPGKSLEVSEVFELRSDTKEIEAEVSTYNFRNKSVVRKTFTLE